MLLFYLGIASGPRHGDRLDIPIVVAVFPYGSSPDLRRFASAQQVERVEQRRINFYKLLILCIVYFLQSHILPFKLWCGVEARSARVFSRIGYTPLTPLFVSWSERVF